MQVKNNLSSIKYDYDYAYDYDFQATELINNELPAEYSESTVTVVITDVDDQLPNFNYKLFHINVSEDIGGYMNRISMDTLNHDNRILKNIGGKKIFALTIDCRKLKTNRLTSPCNDEIII